MSAKFPDELPSESQSAEAEEYEADLLRADWEGMSHPEEPVVIDEELMRDLAKDLYNGMTAG